MSLAFLRIQRVLSPLRANICLHFQKRARRSSPERAESSKKGKGKRPTRCEEDEVDGIESGSVSESEAGVRLQAGRGAHMDDAEFERRNMDRVKAAIERKSASKGVSPRSLLVLMHQVQQIHILGRLQRWV